jgi:hypothetical protein
MSRSSGERVDQFDVVVASSLRQPDASTSRRHQCVAVIV